MAEVKPNLEIWISGYFNQLLTLNSRITELNAVVSKVHETLDGIKEELALIENGNKILMDYFNSEIKKEETLEQQLFKASLAIIQASYNETITVGEFRIKYKDLFDEHERLEKLLEEGKNE